MAPSGDKYLLTLEKGFDCRWRELIWCLAHLELVEINPIRVGIGLWDSQVAIIQSARLKMLLNRKLRTILFCLVWFPLFCWIFSFAGFPLFRIPRHHQSVSFQIQTSLQTIHDTADSIKIFSEMFAIFTNFWQISDLKDKCENFLSAADFLILAAPRPSEKRTRDSLRTLPPYSISFRTERNE